MKTHITRYSSYKDSGIQWLGEIPSHWEIRHLRNFIAIFSEKGYGDKQLLSVTRENGVILRDKNNKEENHNFVPDDLSGYKHLCKGDFVINKMKSWQGSYGVSEYEGIVSPAYFTCKLKGVNPKFFSRAIRSKAYIVFFMQYSKGIRVDQWDLDPNSMKDIPFIIPPLSEQQAIASYLDAVTARVDKAIAQQQKMIDLLKERKQIIINNAVTKGLNPNAPMKDSGIQWFGEIPSHWEVLPLGKFCKFSKGLQITKDNLIDDGLSVVSYGQVHAKYNTRTHLSSDLIRFVPYFYKNGNCNSKVEIGDFIVADTSEDIEGCGNMAFNDCIKELYGGYHTILIKNIHIQNKKYLAYLFNSTQWRSQVRGSVCGVKVFSISKEILKHTVFFKPPIQEQNAIVSYLDSVTAKIDKAIAQQQRMIGLLQERKQIIINSVVTGKVKVC